MSIRADSSSLITGAVVVGVPGLGVLAESVPSTGEHGAGYLYASLEFPADNGKEVRGLITTWPTLGALTAYEDSSFEYDGASDTFAFQMYVDGVAVGTPQTVTITVGVLISPSSGRAQITGYAPAVLQSQALTPSAGRATLTGRAPTLAHPQTIAPASGAIQARGYAPTVLLGNAQLVEPVAGRLSVSGNAPSLSQPITLSPAAGHAQARGYAPTVTQYATVAPSAGRVLATGHAPAIAQPRAITPQPGSAQLAGHAPIVVQGVEIVVAPLAGRVQARGYAPAVEQGGAVMLTPAAGRVSARGYAPVVIPGIRPDTLPIDAYVAAYFNADQADRATHGHDYLRLGERFARRRGLV